MSDINQQNQLLTNIKKDTFQASSHLEERLQVIISNKKLRNLSIKDLSDIKNQLKAERSVLMQMNTQLQNKKAATAKRDKFQEKFTYQNLKVISIIKIKKKMLISRFEKIKKSLSNEQTTMQQDSRHIRLTQKEVQNVLQSRTQVMSQKNTIDILSKIRLGNIQETDLTIKSCLELAGNLDNISSILKLEERDYSKQLEHLRKIVQNKMLDQANTELDLKELEYFQEICIYFFSQEKHNHIFELFDKKFLRFNIKTMRNSSSDTSNNIKILKTTLDDLILILEANAVQRSQQMGAIPEMEGNPLDQSMLQVLKLWDRKIMDQYMTHFFENIKIFLTRVLESSSVKSDRIQQHFFLVNFKNFHQLFLDFDRDIQKNQGLDSIVKEKGIELRKRVADDYYEGYFGVEDLYVKNTGLIYTQLMRQTLQKELDAIHVEQGILKEDGFLMEISNKQIEEMFLEK